MRKWLGVYVRSFQIIISLCWLVLFATACGKQDAPDERPVPAEVSEEQEQPTEPLIKPWGYPLDAFDRATRPGDDFFIYANGGWLANATIPGDSSGTGFSVDMRNRTRERLASIISDIEDRYAARGSPEQRIRDLYKSFMDEARIEIAQLEPFESDLDRLKGLQDHEDVALALADPEMGIASVFEAGVGINPERPTDYIMRVGHGRLGLPDRTYYLLQSRRLDVIRAEYVTHIEEVLTLLDEQNARLRAEAVFQLESRIAELHWTRADRRNAELTFNPMTLGELEQFAPDYPWALLMDADGITDESALLVREKSALPELAALFRSTPVSQWRDYALFHYVVANAVYMPRKFSDPSFGFFRRTLHGQVQPRDRKWRAISFVDNRLGQEIGRLYVERYFSDDAKRQMTEIFENVKAAYRTRIENLTWMTASTKQAALEKLDAMTGQIGYPEVWRDYSGVEISAFELFGNVRRLRSADKASNLARLNQAVEEGEWSRNPQTVNASYSRTRNEAFIPAGYIQSPLFDPNADPALNYGAIGSVVGHEIAHGFDDQGSRYGADGRLENWWTDEDRAAFDSQGQRLVDQFNAYEPLPGLNVNGRQTLGENIGDLAGVTVAYHAYLLSLNGEEPEVIDGFTGPQRFFLGRAQARRYKRTEQGLRKRILSQVHAPMALRVNGIVRNMDEWYDAFDVQPDNELYLAPEDRVRIW
ncbi:MAG: M13 family metallopeptidase [Pseudomonadota bacterium]